ncbi:hypothetical protein GGI25_002591 [Coemansia spiralis]|uniref:Uncharacterized protein n=2 Tax=Coemansia TaxID=4863 RepID=A0A9W8G9Q3_9FUNG|nr:hypothetical protein GGI26_002404 [Coemansia sp. RSA 1358]KAJ2678087.1 hypothetical protein GGI25_002591 [Coemansia spiralis]
MHAFVWYMRRTVIGVTVFERKIRASLISYRCYRIYTVLAVPLIVLVWKWYPHVSALLESYVYLSLDNQIEDPINYFRGSAMTRVGIGGRRLVAAMLVSGGTHVLWYSFISYAYHAVVWKEYLREGLAIWVVGNGTMCTKLN